MEPWGTPALTGYSCQGFPSRSTRSHLLLRKEEIRPNIWPEIPRHKLVKKTSMPNPVKTGCPHIYHDEKSRQYQEYEEEFSGNIKTFNWNYFINSLGKHTLASYQVTFKGTSQLLFHSIKKIQWSMDKFILLTYFILLNYLIQKKKLS